MDIGAVVVSSDGYSDFWPIFFSCWNGFDPLHTIPIYLITQKKIYEDDVVVTINSCDDSNLAWSDRVKQGLQSIAHKHVLLMTEDLLCTSKNVGDGEWLKIAEDFFSLVNPTCLRLTPNPPPQGEIVHPNIAKIPSWAMHRVSLQMTLWNKERLISLLRCGESPWEFEINASKRSMNDCKFYCFKHAMFDVSEVIGRGKVTRKGARLIKGLGLGHLLQRDVYGVFAETYRNWRHLKASIYYMLPACLQKRLITSGLVGFKHD